MTLGEGLLLVVALLAAGASISAAGVAYRSASARLVGSVREMQSELLSTQTSVEALRVAWTKYRAELEGVLEAVEDTLEVTEKKRRRAAAYTSKAEAQEQADGRDLDPLLDLRRRARSGGLPV